MIGASSLGSSFGRLGAYLAGDPGRVEWAETRNMSAGRDWGDGAGPDPFTPREVAQEMDRRAGTDRTAKPVYHLAIAFDPDDRPTDGELRGAVDRTLADLGLADHQALVVRHNDRDHEHVHVMVNRVGEDGRVWSPWRDRHRIRASMEAQERELGVRWTGRNRALGHLPERTAAEQGARERAPVPEPSAHPPKDGRGFAAEVRAAALSDFRGASTWGELDARLAARGWRVERQGQGAVVTDGSRQAKLSSVSRSVGRGRLEQRLGPLRDHERGRTSPPQKGGEVPRTRSAPGRPRTVARRPSTQVRVRRAFADRALTGGGRGRAVGQTAGQNAVRTMGTTGEPEVDPARVALGVVRTRVANTLAAGAPGRVLARRTLRARAVHRDVRPGGRVDRLATLVAEHRALQRIEAARAAPARIQSAVLAVRARAAQVLTLDEKHAHGAFGRALAAVYDEPAAAWRAFGQAVRSEGVGAAATTLAERPEAYGRLRETETTRAFGLVKGETTAPARAAAPEAARLGVAHVGASDRKGAAVEAARALRTELVREDPTLAAARVRESPGVRAVVVRAERSRDALSPGSGPSKGRWRLADIERAIGRHAERIGRPVRGRVAEAGRPVPSRTSKGPAGRVQRALEARVGTPGLDVVARAVKSIGRGLGRE